MAGIPSLTLELNSLQEQEFALVNRSEQIVAARQALAKQAAALVNSGQEYAGNEVVLKNLELRKRRFKQLENQLDRLEVSTNQELQIVRTRLENVRGAINNRISKDFVVHY